MSTRAKKSKKKKSGQRGLLLRGLKWLFVLGLWAVIGLGVLTAWYAAELPKIVDTPRFERRSSISVIAQDGSQLARYGELKGVSVGMEDIPSTLIYAVLAVEDRRFYQHFGIDPVGLARAMARNLKEGHVVQGGSTITQQLAKNLFLSHERTLKRKIQEAILAVWMERQLTKDEILTAYLNRVYLGAGTYGVDAASRTYFSKPVSGLTLYESALMAGLLKAPSRYSPQSNPGLAAQRAKVVLAAMSDAGYITPEEAKSQSLMGLAARPKPSVGQGERYFTDWVTASLGEMIGTPDKDLTIETTLIPAIQDAAEAALAEALRQGKDKNVTQGALIVMSRDGAILAMAGGADYGKSQFNRATQAKRPPGSSFKPIVYLTAIENGRDPLSRIDDTPITSGKYRPENFNGEYRGTVMLTTALTFSLNAATVRLAQETGIANVITMARKLGIEAPLSRDLSLALGSGGVPLIEMVRAYAGVASGGQLVTPYAVRRITDNDENLLYVRADFKRRERAVSRYAAGELGRMMEEVVENGTGRNARLPFRAAGKTGTSQDFRDAWFIGFTDDAVAGVWLGNDDNSPMKGVTGGSLPAQIWRETMLAAHGRYEPEETDDADSGEVGGFTALLRRVLND